MRIWVEGGSGGVDAADGAYAVKTTASGEAASACAALRPSAKRGVGSVWTYVAVEGGVLNREVCADPLSDEAVGCNGSSESLPRP
jgi:hypothetical protein